ncbi:hypothetical protein [Mycoplasmopsis columbinasalis]|uniref:Lipoprotein n=1 Tax=Mycoplasmopsis columbinasalis TaxID=114880 RepID=A0A449B9R4_9BACT|nr:hypothetical protein [Mycoplasmopsis columbinasalis]VEU77908.1 Uncharacterised protein [Mycoplasmopsis columbinasalis]
MRKKLKFCFITTGAALSALTPLIASSCFLSLPKQLTDIYDYAKNTRFYNLKPYEEVNPNATKLQKFLSQRINTTESKYIDLSEHFGSLTWTTNIASDDLQDMKSIDEIKDVIKYYFGSSYLSYDLALKLEDIFRKQITGKYAFFTYGSLQLPNDSLYRYFLEGASKVYHQHETSGQKKEVSVATHFVDVFNYLAKYGLNLNNKQTETGIQSAMPAIFVPLRFNDLFANHGAAANIFAKDLEVDSPKWFEFLRDPFHFLFLDDNLTPNPENIEYNNWENYAHKTKLNYDEMETKRKIRLNIDKYLKRDGDFCGAPVDVIARYFAQIFFYNNPVDTQVGFAYSKSKQDFIYYLEVFDKLDNKYYYFDVAGFYNLYQAKAKGNANFAGLALTDADVKNLIYTKDIFATDWTYKPTLSLNGQQKTDADADYETFANNKSVAVVLKEDPTLLNRYEDSVPLLLKDLRNIEFYSNYKK